MLAILRFGIFSTIFFTVSVSESNVQQSKRILVSDPDFMQKLQDMELKIQSLTSRLSLLESANVTQSSTIQDLSAKVSVQHQTIQNLSSKLTAQSNTNQNLSSSLNVQRKIIQNLSIQLEHSSYKGGAVYVRWGRKACPDNDTEMVYRGYVGGGFYGHYGSAAEYVCLPEDPVWGDHFDDSENRGGKMYGAEYQTNFFNNFADADVPCVVCRSLSRTTSIMIPGRGTCYQGWKQEYSGTLASGDHVDHAASQYVCVDRNPEAVPHSVNNDNGKLFYVVEGICGSLPCPPYVNGRELACSVCTK